MVRNPGAGCYRRVSFRAPDRRAISAFPALGSRSGVDGGCHKHLGGVSVKVGEARIRKESCQAYRFLCRPAQQTRWSTEPWAPAAVASQTSSHSSRLPATAGVWGGRWRLHRYEVRGARHTASPAWQKDIAIFWKAGTSVSTSQTSTPRPSSAMQLIAGVGCGADWEPGASACQYERRQSQAEAARHVASLAAQGRAS